MPLPASGDRLFLRATASGQLGEFGRLTLEPGELRGDDRHPEEHDDEHDPVGERDVLGLAHESASRKSRRFASVRFPTSSMRYIT